MKQEFFILIIFLICLGILTPFFCFPAIFYRIFPQLLIVARRQGAFSTGWVKTDNYPRPRKVVLGIQDLPSYSISFEVVTKKASPIIIPQCQEQLSSWLSTQEGQWGVVVYDLAQKDKFSFGGHQKFHAASVMKLATAVSVFEWMEENKKDLDYLLLGMTLEERLTLLVNKSDNNQWADLETLVTLPKTQRILEENGLANSDIYSNTMTTEDVFLLLKKIYQGELVTVENRQFLFTIMQNTLTEERIPAGVPAEIAVVHKTGTWQGNIHDAGIIFWENPYILVVMTNGVLDPETKIANFSSQVYQILSQGSCD